MSKYDISISKKMILNTGDFSSVQPALMITVKDVDISKIKEAHKALDILTDGLFQKQMKDDVTTMAVIKKMGFSCYFNNINEKEIDKEVKRNIELITKMGE